MYRRDLITAEIKKLAQVLARILGLKTEGHVTEAADELAQALEENFGYLTEMDKRNEEQFRKWLDAQDFLPEMLDSLAAFLYERHLLAGSRQVARNILLIYDDLEKKHHTQSLQNLERRTILEKHIP